ncbi:MAG: zinc ribbon domain-containing protein [Ktedonobacteraceae bacterium]|nr:zinc ribbon domain-containing protein [Ktedonobacteraceae bacterium]
MVTCTACGSDVTGKKFCPRCGAAVQPGGATQVEGQFCPQCNGEVKPGAAFCMHCGASLRSQQVQSASVPPSPPALPHLCPACHTEVSGSTAFCTNCGYNLRTSPQATSAPTSLQCTNCGRQNAPDVRFCGGCGTLMGGAQAIQPNSAPPGQYTQYSQAQQYQQPQYPQAQQSQYAQSPYPQQQYPQQYPQSGYQPEPMMGQPPMVLRCPICMAMAPLGTPACLSCHTSLAGIVPTPANTTGMQGQQGTGLGGFMQGNAGKYAMGALGGAAAVIGGEMLLNGVVDGVENRVGGDMGYGGYRHHHHRDEGLLGGLGELADDIGL